MKKEYVFCESRVGVIKDVDGNSVHVGDIVGGNNGIWAPRIVDNVGLDNITLRLYFPIDFSKSHYSLDYEDFEVTISIEEFVKNYVVYLRPLPDANDIGYTVCSHCGLKLKN